MIYQYKVSKERFCRFTRQNLYNAINSRLEELCKARQAKNERGGQ
jgi:hypothetical protein